jgi:hypothetical protein
VWSEPSWKLDGVNWEDLSASPKQLGQPVQHARRRQIILSDITIALSIFYLVSLFSLRPLRSERLCILIVLQYAPYF